MMIRTLLMLLPASMLWAQSQEPEWRVSNANPPRVVPLYAGQSNPFPLKEPPPAVLPPPVLEEPEVDEAAQALLEAQERAQSAVRSSSALLPNLTGVNPDGYLAGLKGPMVLLGGRWYGPNHSVAVPVNINPAATAAVEELKELDNQLYEQLLAELNAKLAAQGSVNIRIKAIAPDEVTFATPMGDRAKPISQQQW